MSTYRLLKSLPEVKNGTLFTLFKDGLYHNYRPNNKGVDVCFSRECVENKTEWFELQKEYSNYCDDGCLFITGFNNSEQVFQKSYFYF